MANVFKQLATAALLLVATMPFPVSASGSSGSPAKSITPAENRIATDLAHFLFAKPIVMAQITSVIDVNLPQSMLTNSDYGAIEEAYPGVIDSALAAIRPIMLKAYEEKLPLLWSQMAQHYVENYTADEIVAMLEFYRSPTGVRLLQGVRENIDMQEVMDAAVKSGGAQTIETAAAQRAGGQTAVKAANKSLSNADKVAIFRFEQSPLGRKILALIPSALKIQNDWDTYFPEDTLADIDQTRSAAVTRFMDEADAQNYNKVAAPN